MQNGIVRNCAYSSDVTVTINGFQGDLTDPAAIAVDSSVLISAAYLINELFFSESVWNISGFSLPALIVLEEP